MHAGKRIQYDDDLVVLYEDDEEVFRGLWDYLDYDLKDGDYTFKSVGGGKGYYVWPDIPGLTMVVLDF